jgi:hypothetical protein
MEQRGEAEAKLTLQAVRSISDFEGLQAPRMPLLNEERTQWLKNLKLGERIGLFYEHPGHFEADLEPVIVHEFTDWGFFVERGKGLLDVQKDGSIFGWGGKGWVAPL